MCFVCSKSLSEWDKNDDPMDEHRKHAPKCPWVNLTNEAARLVTFQHGWPHSSRTYKPTPQAVRLNFLKIFCNDFLKKKLVLSWPPVAFISRRCPTRATM